MAVVMNGVYKLDLAAQFQVLPPVHEPHNCLALKAPDRPARPNVMPKPKRNKKRH